MMRRPKILLDLSANQYNMATMGKQKHTVKEGFFDIRPGDWLVLRRTKAEGKMKLLPETVDSSVVAVVHATPATLKHDCDVGGIGDNTPITLVYWRLI